MDSEQRLKSLMNKAPVGMMAYRKRALVYANEACLRLPQAYPRSRSCQSVTLWIFRPHERDGSGIHLWQRVGFNPRQAATESTPLGRPENFSP